MNYYELFDIPESPMVDKNLLNSKLIELQRKYHPDFNTNALDAEMEEILELSSAVNKAYAIFKDPMSTVAYFLETRGVMTGDEKYRLPADFLMEMMEVNEKIEEGEVGAVTAEISALERKIDVEIQPVLKVCETGGEKADWMKIKDYYYRKKYLLRILDRLID